MSTTARLIFALTVTTVAFQVIPAFAGNNGALLTDSQAKHAGLRAVWSAHIALDSTRSEITQIEQYIGPKKYWVTFEVTFNNQVDVFSERDRDRYGNIIGISGARARAKKHLDQMIDFGYEATIAPKQHEIAPEVFIYALTSTSNVHCIDGETGQTIWTTQVGTRNFPSVIGAEHNYVAVVNGTRVYCLDGSNGEILFDRRLRGVASGSPVITEDNIFVPTVGGLMEEFSVNNKTYPGAVRSPGRILLSPVATSKSVAWVSNVGHLNVAIGTRISTEQRGIRFRLRTNEKVEAPPTFLEVMEGKRQHNYILLSTVPGSLFCVDEDNGGIMWTFQTGEEVLSSPIAFGDQVFSVTKSNLLFALGFDNGQELWRTPGIKRVISSSEKRLYVIDSRNRLAVLDRKTGSRIATLPTQSLDFQMVNFKTDRIIIGNKTGQIQCLHEQQNTTPFFHRMVKTEKKSVIRMKTQDEKETGGETEVDPFGAGGEADPFGDGADPFGGGADPFGGGVMEEKDPFGGDAEEEKDPFGAGADEKKDDGGFDFSN